MEWTEKEQHSSRADEIVYIVDHKYGTDDATRLFARIAADKFVENRGENVLDKSDEIG